MGKVTLSLTVFFEDPFWVGIFEKAEGNQLSAAKVTFGAEPKDYELYENILKRYCSLTFSPAVDSVVKECGHNPKKLQRDIGKQLSGYGTGTKSQQALKLQYEQNKNKRKSELRQAKQQQTDRLFKMKQQKKKDKHRGR